MSGLRPAGSAAAWPAGTRPGPGVQPPAGAPPQRRRWGRAARRTQTARAGEAGWRRRSEFNAPTMASLRASSIVFPSWVILNLTPWRAWSRSCGCEGA